MPTFSAEYLKELGSKIFKAYGVPEREAVQVAGSLVQSNLFGHDSHGVIRVLQYVQAIQSGDIQAGARIEVERETATTAALNGHWGFGQVIARKAADMAIGKARDAGVCCITVRQSNHVGRLGEYPTIAAEQDMIAIATVNNHGAARRLAPWGGMDGRMSPNPISFAAPTDRGRPVLVDITSTVVAEGKVRVMRNRGARIPEGWILDAEGRPSTDPNDLYGPPPGALLPFGGIVGHKGYALGVMVDILSGALSGAGCSRKDATRIGNAFFITVIDIARFVPVEAFKAQVSDFVAYIKSSRKLPGVDEILIPGEPEYRTMEKRLREGIFVEEETWRQIRELAEKVGLPCM